MIKSKKIISEIIKAMVYVGLALTISTTAVSANIFNKYDLNNDGNVNVIDLNNMKRQVLINSYTSFPSLEESRSIADEYLKETLSEFLYEGCSVESVVNTKNCTIVTVSCVYGNSSCMYNLGSGCYWTNGCINHSMHKKVSVFEGTSGTSLGHFATFRLLIVNGKVKGFIVDNDKCYPDTEIPVIPSTPSDDWYYKSVISDLYFESSPALYVKNFDAIEKSEVNISKLEIGNEIAEVSFYNTGCTHMSSTLNNGFSLAKSSNVVFVFINQKLDSVKYV